MMRNWKVVLYLCKITMLTCFKIAISGEGSVKTECFRDERGLVPQLRLLGSSYVARTLLTGVSRIKTAEYGRRSRSTPESQITGQNLENRTKD
jgi:hypothetical protein